ncbi:MAG: GIY-YIG nuclease family protein, partial [Gammaproteobacteria bacterium]|nr:GIY-YIG nuclease family protein [Gammaproteobacteria bacterium]
MSFWVYLLKCNDSSYYTGHTDDLAQRISQHQSRSFPSCYTATRLPVELVYSQTFATREEALMAERQIKGWGRKKKEAMIQGDWAEVSRLAQNTLRLSALEQDTLRQAQGDRNLGDSSSPVRGEPVEPAHAESASPVRGEPVEPAHAESTSPVRGEPVEP